MPRIVINGTVEPILKSRRISFDPTRGMVTHQEFESTGDGLFGIANECIRDGIPFDLDYNGKVSRCSFSSATNTVGGEEVQADGWQLLANEIQKDIRDHPRVLALPPTGTTGSLQDVLQNVDRHEKGQSYNEDLDGDSLLLFNMLIRGVTHYPVGQYVLRHTTNVSDRYAENVADLGVESIYTTDQLIDEISNADFWANPCPGRLVAKIERIEVQVPTNDDVMWGWRKLPSQETTAANSRIEISNEYWLASWSKLLYPPYSL